MRNLRNDIYQKCPAVNPNCENANQVHRVSLLEAERRAGAKRESAAGLKGSPEIRSGGNLVPIQTGESVLMDQNTPPPPRCGDG